MPLHNDCHFHLSQVQDCYFQDWKRSSDSTHRSGNAAALAFNEVITPHAADFGMTVVQLGAVAQVAAGLGRTISPVAGGVIVIASIAGVNPIDICKRTFIPVCVALVVFTIGMYFF